MFDNASDNIRLDKIKGTMVLIYLDWFLCFL